MKPLLLWEHGHSLSTSGSALILRNRITEREESWEPTAFPYDSVVVEATGGYATWEALRWLASNGATVSLLAFNGRPVSVVLPDYPIQARDRLAQLRAHLDPEKRLAIARTIVEAKVRASLRVVPECAWAARRPKARSLGDLMLYEGRVADAYWSSLGVVRDYPNARDPTNALLNYAYGLLESRARLVVHRLGLEPSVGFLHHPRETKSSFVYDLMEPWRSVADSVALPLREELRSRDFFRMYRWGYRLRPTAAQTLVTRFADRMNDGVERHMLEETKRLALSFSSSHPFDVRS
jgi:CRISP-associated protein Cas1